MAKQIETVIIGAGQAGLATSYYLTRQARKHIVLEKASHTADQWRNQRWDSFALVTPNWALQLPGAAYKGTEPDGFLSRDGMVQYLDKYARQFALPIEFNTEVRSVEKKGDGFYFIETAKQNYIAENVVVATGFFQQPKVPAWSASISKTVWQLHSSRYKNPKLLPPGAVLVVGSGQSGCQIAEELHKAGRKVYLSVGKAGRVPRRYRGKDIIRWLFEAGFFNLTPEQLPPGMGKFDGIPHLSGANGGGTINLHQFAKDGITLLGRVQSAHGSAITLSPDLHETLAGIDAFEKNVTAMIDGYIQANSLPAPEEQLPELKYGFDQPVINKLHLGKAGIDTVIWATGYSFDYSILKLPVLDKDGFPLQRSGIAHVEGLYFVGMPWMPSEKSGFLAGVGEAARNIAYHIGEGAHL
jgi:putative flavoprotein involved in K+ transport